MSLIEARVVTRADAAALAAYRNGRLGDVVVAEDGSGAGIVTDPTAAPTPVGSAGFVPTNDNLTDLGDASHRFRTLYLGTSITNAGDLGIALTGGATRTLSITNTTPAQVANVYVDGAVQGDGGGVFGTVLAPLATNTVDLGLTGNRWRTLYLGTKLDTPLIEHSGDVTVDLLGAGGAHTFSVTCSSGGAGRADLSVQGYVQTYGPGILLAAVPSAFVACNGINASLKLYANGNGVLALRDPADAITVLGVTGHGVVVSSAVDAGVGPTINRPTGVVTIPNGSVSIAVNNDLVTAGPPASMVHATIQNATTNAVSVLSAVPGPGVLVITLSGDPGASGAQVAFLVLNQSV